jgi:hypothetical protein
MSRNVHPTRDTWLIHNALRHVEEGSNRHAFVLRLARSCREYGSLTTAMRVALTSSSS